MNLLTTLIINGYSAKYILDNYEPLLTAKGDGRVIFILAIIGQCLKPEKLDLNIAETCLNKINEKEIDKKEILVDYYQRRAEFLLRKFNDHSTLQFAHFAFIEFIDMIVFLQQSTQYKKLHSTFFILLSQDIVPLFE